MKIAICISGEPRQFEYTYENCLDYYSQYKPDIYIHSWANVTHPGDNGEGRENNHLKEFDTKELKEELKKLYNPKEILIESKNVLDKKVAECNIPFSWLNRIKNSNLCSFSQWYSMMMCNNLKKTGQIINNIKYDIVIKTRFDVFLDPRTNNSRQLIEYLNTENLKRKDFTQTGDCVITPWLYMTYKGQNWMEYCHMYATSNAMDTICEPNMLQHLSKYPLGTPGGNPHHVITEYLKDKKVPIVSKDINYGIVRPNTTEKTTDLTVMKRKYDEWRSIK